MQLGLLSNRSWCARKCLSKGHICVLQFNLERCGLLCPSLCGHWTKTIMRRSRAFSVYFFAGARVKFFDSISKLFHPCKPQPLQITSLIFSVDTELEETMKRRYAKQPNPTNFVVNSWSCHCFTKAGMHGTKNPGAHSSRGKCHIVARFQPQTCRRPSKSTCNNTLLQSELSPGARRPHICPPTPVDLDFAIGSNTCYIEKTACSIVQLNSKSSMTPIAQIAVCKAELERAHH